MHIKLSTVLGFLRTILLHKRLYFWRPHEIPVVHGLGSSDCGSCQGEAIETDSRNCHPKKWNDLNLDNEFETPAFSLYFLEERGGGVVMLILVVRNAQLLLFWLFESPPQ